MGTYYLKTAPTTEPVTLAEAKAQCRVDITEDDGYIDQLIATARRMCEEWASPRLASDTIELAVGPLQSVTSIKYTDIDGVPQALLDEIIDNGSL